MFELFPAVVMRIRGPWTYDPRKVQEHVKFHAERAACVRGIPRPHLGTEYSATEDEKVEALTRLKP